MVLTLKTRQKGRSMREILLNVEVIESLKDNYIWLLVNYHESSAFVVDPGEAPPVLSWLKKRKINLLGILITHHHADHTMGVEDLVNYYDIPVYGPHNSPAKCITKTLQENDDLILHGIRFSVIEVPGHTNDHIAYFSSSPLDTNHVLFVGDTLFGGGCGKLFEGTAQQMYSSLEKIKGLPQNTLIYSGHEYTLANLNFAISVEPDNKKLRKRYQDDCQKRNMNQPTLPSLLSLELDTNPFLRVSNESVFSAIQDKFNLNDHNEQVIFEALRKWKDIF